MKILHIDYDDLKNPWAAGGQARGTFEVCRRLVRMGHDVTVVTSTYPGAKDEVIEGIKYRRVGGGGGFSSFIRFILALPRVVKKIDHDLLIENFTVPISTTFTPLFTKKPVIGYASNFFAREMSQKYKLPFFLVENLGARFYQAFIALSESTKKRLEKLNKNAKIAVIPRGIDQRYFIPYNKHPKHLLYIGRVDIHQKGLDLLLEAFSMIADEFPEIDLYIAGIGKKTDQKKIEKLAFSRRIRERIMFVGRVLGEDKIKLINDAYAFCISSRYETFGNTALEAAACGKPCVVFDIAGFEWLPSTVALKVKSFSIEGYADALRRILSDENLRKEAHRNGQAFAKQFSWDDVAKKHEKFYQEVLEGKTQ